MQKGAMKRMGYVAAVLLALMLLCLGCASSAGKVSELEGHWVDVNSKTTVTEAEGAEFKSNRVMRVIMQFCNDAYRYYSNFVLVFQDFVQAGVDTQIMAKRTEGIEALFVVDEIIIRFVVNRGIRSTNAPGQIRHNAGQLLVKIGITVDTVLLLHLGK